MGIQINGNTDNITATDGGLSITSLEINQTGISTFQAGINVSGGQLDVGSNIKIGTAGVVTATSFVGSGANLTGISQVGGSTGADFNDNIKVRFGTGNDFELFHSGSVATIYENQGNEINIITTGNIVNKTSGTFKILNLAAGQSILESSNSAGTILKQGGVEKFRTNSTGAQVSGNLRLGTSGSGNIYHSGDDDTNIGFPANDTVSIETAGSEKLRIDSTGRMTQNGTTSADTASALTLKNGAAANEHTILELISDPNQYSMIYLGASDDRYRGQIRYKDNDHFMAFHTSNAERLRIGSSGQLGIAGANYGTARETIVSGGASAAVSWSANPFVLDMVGLGDIDYGKMFVRYRETATVSGNGLVYLGICKSTTNCPAGRAGTPIGFIPSTTYNGHFRVDKIGITPWPDSSGHRYEYYAIISDYVSSGKLGVFYLTNTTS